jgi:hypothetical protein
VDLGIERRGVGSGPTWLEWGEVPQHTGWINPPHSNHNPTLGLAQWWPAGRGSRQTPWFGRPGEPTARAPGFATIEAGPRVASESRDGCAPLESPGRRGVRLMKPWWPR